jgi:hypothetical protein
MAKQVKHWETQTNYMHPPLVQGFTLNMAPVSRDVRLVSQTNTKSKCGCATQREAFTPSVTPYDWSSHRLCHDVSFIHCVLYKGSWGSSVSIVSGYGLDDRSIELRSPAEAKRIFPLTSVSRPNLEPTQPPTQRVTGVLSPGIKRGWGVTLTTHPI